MALHSGCLAVSDPCLRAMALLEIVFARAPSCRVMRSMAATRCREHVSIMSCAELGEPFEQRPRGRREIQPLGAPIVRVGAPLDQAVVAQPVDQPRQRDRLDVEHFGEFRLLEALIALEPHSTAHCARVMPNWRARWSA